MLISDLINRDEVSSLIIGELKELGVKYRGKEKRVKATAEKSLHKRIFRTHLHLLELTDVVLANGGIVQIPQFVSEACQRILENVEIEGLFRKAGSSIRQRELRTNLESGLPLGKCYHVIDVANVLKSFFRELPEPLLPYGIHETLNRSLLIGDGRRFKAILMSCLLLPPLTINTLAFVMQFLHTISLNSHLNKMSVDNLAIIFTPGLMPDRSDKTGTRFNNHVKIIKILIENAEMIGVLPENIIQKLTVTCEILTPPQLQQRQQQQKETKKKKRRSGSLTRVFNGLRKIVGAIGSSENLDDTPDNKVVVTPCLSKSTKKRKLADNSGFSAKKKKEILDFMPSGNGGLLPNTPLCTKEIKKSRLSLGGRKNLKYPSAEKTDKRWSIVASNWSRKRNKPIDESKISTSTIVNQLPPVVSMPCISNLENSLKLNIPDNEASSLISQPIYCEENLVEQKNGEISNDDSSDYVRISKSEYESIKERVAAIEKRVSQEFCNITRSLCNSSLTSSVSSSSTSSTFDNEAELSGPEKVLNKFEKTIEETENMTSSSSSTDHLAKRLSRELKIRRSADSRVFRSPSQRKIKSIRRRSRENSVRLSRNNTWHISSTATEPQQSTTTENDKSFITELSFYPKNCLKRGRPNTVQTGLQQPPQVSIKKDELLVDNPASGGDKENWVAGELFFDNDKIELNDDENDGNEIFIDSPNSENNHIQSENTISTPITTNIHPSVNIHIQPVTPKFITRITINDTTKTPMLPPKSIPKRTMNSKTPLKPNTSNINCNNKKLLTTPIEETQNGRASIARLRAQNAGMVLAKAKLFDGLGNEATTKSSTSTAINSIENRRKSMRFMVVNKTKQLEPEWKCEDIVNEGSNKISIHQKENEFSPSSSSSQQVRIKTPTNTMRNKRVLTPKLAAQKRATKLNVTTTIDNTKFKERMLLGALVNEGQIQSKGDRSKVTSIRNISNTNRYNDSPNRHYTSKMLKKSINSGIGNNSPRTRLIRSAR